MKKLVLSSAKFVTAGVVCALANAGNAASPVDYAKKLTVTANSSGIGYEAAMQTDIPVPVRLSEAIDGFRYSDFMATGDDKDLLFTDSSGNQLPYEIETWNPDGESVVWVRLPNYGIGTRFYAYYGGGGAVVQNAAGVWSGYGGVWHMGEASGDVADSSGNGRTATPDGESKDQNIGTAGVLGGARVNCTTGTAYLRAANSTQLGYGDALTVSGWFRLDTANPDGQPTLITTKQRRWDDCGWGLRLDKGSDDQVVLRGRGDADWATLVVQGVPLKGNWVHLLVAYGPGSKGALYVNGEKATTLRSDELTETDWIQSAADSDYPLTFGFNANDVWDDGWSRPFWGAYDEIRISGGTMDAARARAEYRSQVANAFHVVASDNDSTGYRPSLLENFSKTFTVTSGYAGTETYSEFPMLVRLSESGVGGFRYADFMQEDFSDLAFFDADGTSLAFDVDTWNPDGESLVWVKVPSFSATTIVTVAYGGLVQNDVHQPSVWSGYRGVWHLNEAGDGEQSVSDATVNAMDGVSHAETASVADGQLGGARLMAKNRGDSDQNGGVRIPFNEAMNIAGDKVKLVASAWFRLTTGGNWGGAFFARKNNHADGGWGMTYNMKEMNHYDFYFRENYDGLYTPWDDAAGGYRRYSAEESIWNAIDDTEAWHKVTFAYEWVESVLHANVYLDGKKGSESWLYNYKADDEGNKTDERSYAPIYQPTDRGLALGAFLGDGRYPLLGAMDEARLRTGDISEDREALEFAQESEAGFHTPSAVSSVANTTVPSHVVLDREISIVRRDADGEIILDVSGNVLSLVGESAELQLLLCSAEQKDGDSLSPVRVDAKTVTETGAFIFSWNGAKLGTRVTCRVTSEVAADASHTFAVSTDEASLLLEDSVAYEWVANAKGAWSDSANWICKATDGLPRVGYPTWGSQFNVYGNQTDVIQVDANYQGLSSGSTLGWAGADITFVGTVDDAEIGYPDTAGFKDGQYADVKVSFDNVRLAIGNYHVCENSSLVLTNGAYLSTRWEFLAEADNARVDVSTGSELNQIGVDGDRFGLAGIGTTLRIDDGIVRANALKIGGKDADETAFVGKSLGGIIFAGSAPRLVIQRHATIYTAMGASMPIVFEMPTNGFSSAAIVKGSATDGGLFELAAESLPGVVVSIDKRSPFYSLYDAQLAQELIDWRYGDAAYGINTAAISFVNPRGANPGFTYEPSEGETKSRLFVSLRRSPGFMLIIR